MRNILACLALLTALAAPAQEALTLTSDGSTLTLTPGGNTLLLQPTVAADSILYVSNFPSLQAALTAAQAANKWLYLPNNYSITQKLEIHGNVKIGAASRVTVIDNTTKADYGNMWKLHEGTHLFKNLIFTYPGTRTENYNCLQTEQADIVYNDSFYNCRWVGNWYNNYQSTQGHAWNRSSFVKCRFFAESENIQYFAQLGGKQLIIIDDTFHTLYSHNIYSHPINSHRIDGMLTLGCNINALNIYGTASSVISGTNGYCILKRLKVADTTVARSNGGNKPTWRIWSTSAPVYLDSSNIAPYEFYAGSCFVSNTNFYNAGNGVYLGGNPTVTNCTGLMKVRAGSTAIITNSTAAITFESGCTATMSNCTTRMEQYPGNIIFNNINFVEAYDHINSSSNNVTFNNCTFSGISCIRTYGSGTAGFTFNTTVSPGFCNY